VIACRYLRSWTSPQAKTPATLAPCVRGLEVADLVHLQLAFEQQRIRVVADDGKNPSTGNNSVAPVLASRSFSPDLAGLTSRISSTSVFHGR